MFSTRFSRAESLAAALAYAVAGLAAYYGILRCGFLADDWLFLSYAVPARSVLVCFEPLAGHFVRPLVMLTYYVNYSLFGLSPLPYHLSVIALHSVNAFLVCQVAVRVTGRKRTAFAAGLLFAVFSGHSEAVGWVAGVADVWLAMVLLSGLLLFARGLRETAGAGWLAGAVGLFVTGYLAKESAAIGVGLVTAWGIGAGVAARDAAERRRIAVRTAFVAGALVCAVSLYLAARAQVFGTAFGAYQQLNADRSIFLAQAAAFLIRSFLPASGALVYTPTQALAIAAILGGIAAIALTSRRDRPAQAGLTFACLAFLAALAPVLPLTISLATSTSERFVYVPTAFSCILTAWAASAVFGRRRELKVAAIAALVVVQYPALARTTRERLSAATLFQTFMSEAVAVLRSEAPTADSRVFFLTLPDSVNATSILRNGFHTALTVLAPDITNPGWRAPFIASNLLASVHDQTTARREGDATFRVQIQGQIIENAAPQSRDFRISEWSRTGYVITFEPSRWRRTVVFESGGHVQRAAGLNAGKLDALPFGAIDVPPIDAACQGEKLRFSGWALDDEPNMDVFVQQQTENGGWADLARADRVSGTRPDIAKAFAAYPDTDRAEWDYYLPCTPRRPGGIELRIVARDSGGHEAVLGSRRIQ